MCNLVMKANGYPTRCTVPASRYNLLMLSRSQLLLNCEIHSYLLGNLYITVSPCPTQLPHPLLMTQHQPQDQHHLDPVNQSAVWRKLQGSSTNIAVFCPAPNQSARHILRCEHLRLIPGEGFPPYRVAPQYTHQIWLWYRTQERPARLMLVFRGQFECVIPGRPSDQIAKEVTQFLANYLMTVEEYERVIRQNDSDLFWATLINTKIESLKGGQGQILL